MQISPVWMILWAVLCCVVASIAVNRNRSMWLWFVWSMLLTPPLALILLLRLGKSEKAMPKPVIQCRLSKETKPCTFCRACGLTALADQQ